MKDARKKQNNEDRAKAMQCQLLFSELEKKRKEREERQRKDTEDQLSYFRTCFIPLQFSSRK